MIPRNTRCQTPSSSSSSSSISGKGDSRMLDAVNNNDENASSIKQILHTIRIHETNNIISHTTHLIIHPSNVTTNLYIYLYQDDTILQNDDNDDLIDIDDTLEFLHLVSDICFQIIASNSPAVRLLVNASIYNLNLKLNLKMNMSDKVENDEKD